MYDYEKAKERIKEILFNSTEIEKKEIPRDDSNFTYNNGIKSWIGSIFIDIIDSKKMMENNSEIKIAKILRIFSSEVITILNSSEKVLQIGIRGDCVYAVFSCPTKEDVKNLANLTFYINTLSNMINKMFKEYDITSINFGIGMAVGNDLIIKAGKKGAGINDRIWIGDAVVQACVIADKAARNGKPKIGFNETAYNNFIDILEKENSSAKTWFRKYIENGKTEYYADIVKTEFNSWIKNKL